MVEAVAEGSAERKNRGQRQFTIPPDQFEFIKRMRYEHDLAHSETVQAALDLLMKEYERRGVKAIHVRRDNG